MSTAANGKKVYAKAAAGAPSGADEIDGVIDATVSFSRDMLDTTDYFDGIYRTRIYGLADVSISLSGDYEQSDAPHALIRTSQVAGSTIYITVLPNGTNGFTYPCLVESYESSGDVASKNAFSASFVLTGAPVAVP